MKRFAQQHLVGDIDHCQKAFLFPLGINPFEANMKGIDAEEFPAIPEISEQNLLGEPTGRDTANAVGFPAAVLLKRDREAVLAVVTADHVITPVERFAEAIQQAFELVEQYPNSLVTLPALDSFAHSIVKGKRVFG